MKMIKIIMIIMVFSVGTGIGEVQPIPDNISMKFGVSIDSVSDWYQGDGNPFNMTNAKKEIDLASSLGVDFARFDIRQELLDSPSEIKKLDEIINYARSKNLGIEIGVYGRFMSYDFNLWINPLNVIIYYPKGGSGKSSWETFKTIYMSEAVFLANRYHPDYIMIMGEAPFLMGNQVNSVRTINEWVKYTLDVAEKIKRVSPKTKILTNQMVRSLSVFPNSNFEYTEALMANNSTSVDIIGIDPYSFNELNDEIINVVYLKNKYDWHGKLWIGETNIINPESDEQQKQFFQYAVATANQNAFDGFVIFYLRQPDPFVGAVGIVNEDGSLKPAFLSLKTIIDNR